MSFQGGGGRVSEMFHDILQVILKLVSSLDLGLDMFYLVLV